MGDGQHVWAAAEWVLMLRNMFLREEDRVLVIASAFPKSGCAPASRCPSVPGPPPSDP